MTSITVREPQSCDKGQINANKWPNYVTTTAKIKSNIQIKLNIL